MLLLITAINGFARVLVWLLIARAICSWFIRPGSSAYRVYLALVMLTEPLVAPCRKITQRFPTGMFDFSIIIAFILVEIIRFILISVLLMLV